MTTPTLVSSHPVISGTSRKTHRENTGNDPKNAQNKSAAQKVFST